jgi:predicted site-specific integrase-resolvase
MGVRIEAVFGEELKNTQKLVEDLISIVTSSLVKFTV